MAHTNVTIVVQDTNNILSPITVQQSVTPITYRKEVIEISNGIKGDKGKDGIDGINGTDGKDGITYTPIVSGNVLSWSNNGNKPNPVSLNFGDIVSSIVDTVVLDMEEIPNSEIESIING